MLVIELVKQYKKSKSTIIELIDLLWHSDSVIIYERYLVLLNIHESATP